jgi:GNAT superfamily N-acetyltransferase
VEIDGLDVHDVLPEVDEVVDLLSTRTPEVDRVILRTDLEPRTATSLRVLGVRDEEGRLAGAAYARRSASTPAGTALVHVATRADVAGRRVASGLFGAVVDGLDGDVTRLVTSLSEADPVAREVAARWGFSPSMRSLTSSLALADTPSRPDAAPDGTTVEPCDRLEVADEPEVETMLLASQTNPEFEQGLVLTLAGLRATPTPEQQPVAVLARVGGRPAALSYAVADGEQMHVVYTGVDPAFRGHGLARRTKQHLHARARSRGVRVALTDNAPDNVGIRRVNEGLGYRPHSAWQWLTRPV